jgi:hypothetical protein
MRQQLVRWQWDGYPQFHGSKLNLWLHIFAVPAFILSFFNVLWSLAHLAFISAAISFVGMIIAFAVQAIGHKQEKTAAIPFDGPGDAVSRIFVEQLVTFPRFFFSGGWWRAMRGDKGGAA